MFKFVKRLFCEHNSVLTKEMQKYIPLGDSIILKDIEIYECSKCGKKEVIPSKPGLSPQTPSIRLNDDGLPKRTE